MRRFLHLLLACSMLTAIFSTYSQAQDTANAKWGKGVANQPLVFSGDGSALLTAESNSVRAWSTSTFKLTALVGITPQSWVPAHNGSGFYYGTNEGPSKVYFYNFATRVSTLIRTDVAGYQSVYLMALSANGAKIAILTLNTSNSRYYLVVFNSATGAQLARIALPPGFTTDQIAFCNGDARILVGGMRLHPANGTSATPVATRTTAGTQIYKFTLSPDRTKAYGVDSSNHLVGLDLTAASTLPEVFSVASTTATDSLKCTSDGNALVSTGLSDDNAYYSFRLFSTATGAKLAGSIDVSTDQPLGFFAVSPATNELLAVHFQNGYRYKRFNFNTSTGAGSQLSDFAEGIGGYSLHNVGAASAPRVAHNDLATGMTRLRNATTGESLGQFPSSAVFSPNAANYAYVGYRASDSVWGVHIYRASDDALLASVPNDNFNRFGWGNDSRIWVGRDNNQQVPIYDFNGSALTLATTVSGPANSAPIFMSQNGLRLVSVGGANATVYNVETGDTVGTITSAGTWNNFKPTAQIVGNKILLNEWTYDGGTTWTNLARFHDLMDNSLAQAGSASYTQSFAPYDYVQANSTPDGSLVVFTAGLGFTNNYTYDNVIKAIRVKDNAIVKQFNNQFTDDSWFTAGISTDGATLTAVSWYGKVLVGIDLPSVLTSVSVSPDTVMGGSGATGTVTISRPAPAGGVVISLTADTGVTVPATVTVTEGNTSATFSVSTAGVDVTGSKSIGATYDGLTLHTDITVIQMTALTVTFNPTSVNSGQTSTGTVTLNAPAGPSGITVNLSSDKAFVTVPASVHFSAGQTTKTFTANTSDPGATDMATVTGTRGDITGSGTLTVVSAGASLAFDVASITGGNALVLTITLATPAPTGGATFTFTGDAAMAPLASITIPAGQSTYSVGINTNAVSADTVGTLTVTRNAVNQTIQATVKAPVVISVASAVTSITGVKAVKFLVVLSGPAPTGGIVLPISLNNATVTAPASVTIPAGQIFATFEVTTKKQTTAKIANVTVGGKVVKLNLRPAP